MNRTIQVSQAITFEEFQVEITHGQVHLRNIYISTTKIYLNTVVLQGNFDRKSQFQKFLSGYMFKLLPENDIHYQCFMWLLELLTNEPHIILHLIQKSFILILREKCVPKLYGDNKASSKSKDVLGFLVWLHKTFLLRIKFQINGSLTLLGNI